MEWKIETKIISPFLIDGVEVVTKKEQDQMDKLARLMGERIDQQITDLLMGITSEEYKREYEGDWSLLEEGE